MSKIKNGELDQYGAGPLNSNNLEQLVLKGLTFQRRSSQIISWLLQNPLFLTDHMAGTG